MAPKIIQAEGDNDAVRLLNPERYTRLPANTMSGLLQRNEFRGAKRYRLLADGLPDRPGLGYLERHWEPWKHNVYERTAKGDLFAGEPNARRSKHNFAHQMLQDLVQASIEYGCITTPDCEFVHWPELRNNGWTNYGKPQFVRDEVLSQPDPHFIKLPSGAAIRGDGAPVLIKVSKRQLFVLAKEIDRSTEPFETTHDSRRNLKQKIENYKELFETKDKHYGFPNNIVIFVFIKESRRDTFLKYVEEIYEGPCGHIVTYVWKDWANERSYPDPTDYIFTIAGKRAGHSDLYLNKFWES